jgi:hypothetical protein
VHVNSFLTKDVNEGVYAIPNENFSKWMSKAMAWLG